MMRQINTLRGGGARSSFAGQPPYGVVGIRESRDEGGSHL